MSDENKFTEEDKKEPEIIKKDPPPAVVKEEKIERTFSDNDDDDDDTQTILEKFAKLELETKTGLICALMILLALIFSWDWFNATWWVVLLFGAAGVKTLYTQMSDLEEEKPDEAKLAKYSFMILICLLILRDLYITSRLSDFLDIIKRPIE
jgi:hypothetical protein